MKRKKRKYTDHHIQNELLQIIAFHHLHKIADNRGVPRIERGGVHVAISGGTQTKYSVVIHSTLGVRMCALYLGGVHTL